MAADAALVDLSRAPILRSNPGSFRLPVYPNFVSADEESVLSKELTAPLKRKQYNVDHWDNVINGYRELIKSTPVISAASMAILNRVYSLFPPQHPPMQQVHVLDLQPGGAINRHVDSIKFSGHFVVGLCLLSDAVLHLHCVHNDDVVTALLPARCLYVMSFESRSVALLLDGDVCPCVCDGDACRTCGIQSVLTGPPTQR